MRTTREEFRGLVDKHTRRAAKQGNIMAKILLDWEDYQNIVDAIGKINPINKPGFEVLDRIKTIIQDNGDKR